MTGPETEGPSGGLLTLVNRIEGRIANGERTIIGICGAPGAGKSTLAARLQEVLGPETCLAVPMDGYHLAAEVLTGTDLESRRGAIETFDIGGLLNLIRRLRANDESVVYAPRYAREIEDPIAASIRIDQSVPAIAIEGNYLLSEEPGWIEARALLDEVWFVDIAEETRLRRLIARHIEFGRSPDEAVRWAMGSDLDNARYIQSMKANASLRFDMELLFGAEGQETS